MTDLFDPYHTWLGIPPSDQPPNHYRLLGIELLEDNLDVISNAADRQMAFLRQFQSGTRVKEAQQLLNEISSARTCLLNPQHKAAYDANFVDELPDIEIIEEDATPEPEPPQRLSEITAPSQSTGQKTFGDYVIVRKLDASRTGGVFKAQHRLMGKTVALKVLSAQAVQSAELMRRFRRKVKILARLNHPNLVKILSAGQRGQVPYLVLEFIDGQNLSDLISSVGPLSVAHAVNYTMQAASGLAYAHSQGIYHRNVKPANLMVSQRGVITIIGLGLAKMNEVFSGSSIAEQLTAPGVAMGTCDYMAPEQFVSATAVDHRADIYSLGCTLYTLLTGEHVYPVKSPVKKALAHRGQPIPPLSTKRDDVTPQLDFVYQRMLAKQPEERFQSMQDVFDALQSV